MTVNKTTNLARVLQKYYLRQGKKIIFSNKMTLNQLALEMWEKLGYREIDASVISRVLKGERIFTLKQLQVLSNILSLNKQQRLELKKTIINDILQHKDIEFEEFISYDQKYLNKMPLTVRLLRDEGHPNLAINLSFLLEDILSEGCLNKETKTILGKVYNEKSRAYGLICQPNVILNHMSDLNNKAIFLGKEIHNQEILDMAYMNVGGANYVAKNWRFSSEFLENKYNIVGKANKLEFLRTLLLDYAYLNDFNSFKRIYKKTVKFLAANVNLQLDNLISLYEALARSLSIFGFIKEARKILDEARKLDSGPFYQSQLIRGMATTFYYEAKKGKKIDQDQLFDMSKEIFNHLYDPYKRHKQQIKNILKIFKINYVSH